jgi:hypothetical protein
LTDERSLRTVVRRTLLVPFQDSGETMLRTLTMTAALAAAALAQSPLTTTYAAGNGLGAGATIYFDVVVAVPLTFTQFDINSSSAAQTSGSIDVRWCNNTYVGNDTNAAAWTLGGSGPAIAAGANLPTPVVITPFSLAPGNYGMAITFNTLGMNYTNGNGTAVPGSGTNQTYATGELTLLAGASAGGAVGTAICCQPRVFNGSVYYSVSGGGGTVAQRVSYGAGCYNKKASFYENFATSAAFDLANSALSMLPTGSGYLALPGITQFVPPSAAATTLTLGDDTETTVALAAPFPHSAGATNSLTVCSNGFVSIATGNGTGYIPTPATTLSAPQTAWWAQHDYNPAAAGSGAVKFEQIAGVAYITWDGVYDYGGTAPTSANTFQFQFDTTSGAVHLVFQTMSPGGNGRLVGYSPGGASADPGNFDLSAVLPATINLTASDLAPLALAASARPLVGTTINLTASNTTGANIGVNFLSVVQIPAPGFDLGVLGAPGCAALVDVNAGVSSVIGNVLGLSLSAPFAIPATAPLGVQVFSQSVWLDATQNAFGILTSNGVTLTLGNL